VIIGLPESAEVHVPDPTAAGLITSWLATNGKLHDWLLDQRTEWSLPEVLSRDLGLKYEIARGGPAFLNQPKPEDKAVTDVEFSIRFRARPPRPGISGLDINVMTKLGSDSHLQTVQLDLGELAPHVVSVGVAAQSEVQNEQDAKNLKAALAQVARQAWVVSQSHGIVIGSKVDDDTFPVRKSVTEQELANLYTITGRGLDSLGWPSPKRPSLTPKAPVEAGAWVLTISGVQGVRDVTIEVPLVQIKPGAHESPESIERRKAAAMILKQDTELKAKDHLRKVLDSLRNTVPTNPSMRAALGAVEAEPVLLPPATASSKDQEIVFRAGDRRPRFGFNTTVEGGWSSEDRIVGKGTFNGDNLFRLSDPGNNRFDSQTLSFSGGSRVQQFSGSWQLLTVRDLGRQSAFKWTLGVAGMIRYDTNQLLGNAPGTRLSLESRRIGPTYTLEYGSPLRTRDDKAKVFIAGWKSTVGPYLGFGGVAREDGFPEGQGSVTSGKYAAFTLDEQLQLMWRLRPPERAGIGEIRARVTATGEYSPDWLQYHFRRAEATAEVESVFGFSQSRDFLLRYRVGLAAASASAPLFELPRLGGPDSVRGIEQGEQIGRKSSFSQLSAGPSIEYVVTWFKKERPAKAALGPIKLADTYVTAFFDRGAAYQADQRSGLDRLLWPSQAIGYGAAVEMRNFAVGSKRARLSIGYAYSPDSIHHSHGFPVTSLAIDLN
jgi:hypothetical protein